MVRARGYLRSPQDIENTVIAVQNGTPVLVRNVAKVREGFTPRRGAVARSGAFDSIEGTILLRRGENPKDVLNAVHAAVDRINHDVLPKGMQISPFYDRPRLVDTTLTTVSHNMLLGAGGDWRRGAPLVHRTRRFAAVRGRAGAPLRSGSGRSLGGDGYFAGGAGDAKRAMAALVVGAGPARPNAAYHLSVANVDIDISILRLGPGPRASCARSRVGVGRSGGVRVAGDLGDSLAAPSSNRSHGVGVANARLRPAATDAA